MKLYIVATPIGNLEDITLRALRILKEVDLIACEDTRNTKILLNHYEIKKDLISFHEHSKLIKINKIIDLIKGGNSVAVVTDAGTPGISDPGGLLVSEAIKEGIEVIDIPGPSALTALLSISGIYLDEFAFYGFLPTKKGRQTKLKKIADEKRPVVLYESPHRIKKLMDEILEFVGDKEIIVGRELTKKFEEVYRGKVSEVKDEIKEKGEFVVIIY